MQKIDKIAEDTKILRERLVDKIPAHFDAKHIVSAFFGALFFGFTFVLKGLLLEVGFALDTRHIIIIILSTILILTAQIYFIGYTKVHERKNRPFLQFWIKRLTAYYVIAIFTSFFLLTAYGMTTSIQSNYFIFKLVVAISFPAAIGAGTAHLLGKY